MDSIKDLLHSKSLDEPSEVKTLKRYVHDIYGYEPTIKVNDTSIFVYMHSAAEASTLRMRHTDIHQRCQLTRKLYIKIGQARP